MTKIPNEYKYRTARSGHRIGNWFDPRSLALLKLFSRAQVPGMLLTMCIAIGHEPDATTK